MNPIVPYLNFEGNGFEALAFYEKALNGKILFSQSFGDSPMGAQTPDDYKNKLMHGSLRAGELMFMASDTPPHYEVKRGNNISLSLNFNTIDEMEKVFNGLSEGGNVVMPLQETFWAERFGLLTDKYGINWMFNKDNPQNK